jgi:LysM repeat protein
MKLRDTVILVVLAHVGLVLVWVCMGGCANNKATQPKGQAAAVAAEKPAKEVPATTEVTTRELPTPITVEETKPPAPKVTLPETGVTKPAEKPEEKPVEPSPKEIKIVVKKGDTLWAISRRYKVPVSVIVDRNDIQDPSKIQEGRELIIPLREGAPEQPEEPAPAKTEPEPKPAAPESSGLSPGSEAVPVAQDVETSTHTVAAGDTIWTIARKYRMSSAKIMEANNIADPTKLQVGQQLRIPKSE